MTLHDALERTLKSYGHYYTVRRGDAAPPFQAEALFLQHDERYFLSRGIRLSESDSRDTVFFATVERLDAATFTALDEAAWSTGLSRVQPEWGHRGADVGLVILTNHLEPDAADRIRVVNRSRGYFFSLKGWTNYRLIAMEVSTGRFASNRLGRQLADTLRKTLTQERVLS